MLALQSAADRSLSSPYPFDVLGAETQGMIGYWLLQSLQNALPGRQVCALLNQTLVSAADPAFTDPAKFVGPVYDRTEAERLAAERGWTVKQDGAHWRRVVPSPVHNASWRPGSSGCCSTRERWPCAPEAAAYR